MDTPSSCMPSTHEKKLPAFESGWAFFLDVDGTLLELASHPDAVVLGPQLTETLEVLRIAINGAIALISGRSIEDLDNLFKPLRMPIAGQHGLERRDYHGEIHHHKLPVGELDNAKKELSEFADENRGILIEDKGISLAVHYRQAPNIKSDLETLLKQLVSKLSGDFHLQQGKMIYEIKPSGKDKGIAIEEYMQEQPFCGRIPVFIGDDSTDEDGFRSVNKLQGYSIKVGAGSSEARWRLPDSDGVLKWLQAYRGFIEKLNQDK
jgi:trehalose 6-phosphate phosphatase